MKKRGVAFPMLLASEVVVAAIILLLLMNHAVKWSSSERPYQAYLAKDMALIISSLYSSPGGNILIDYTQNASNFTVSINEENVSLYRKGPKTDDISRKFIGTETDKIITKLLEKPNKIQFAKIGNKIIIDNQLKVNLNTLFCDETTGETLKDKKILIDPGYEEGNIEESKKICNIGNGLISNIIAEGFDPLNILSTIKFDVGEPKSLYCKDISKTDASIDANVIISLRAGKYDNEKNNIKAFIISGSGKEKESKILACLIINSILSNKRVNDVNIDGVSIIPVNLETTNENFPKYIFLKNGEKAEDFNAADFDKTFVLLEIGNAESEQGKLLLGKISELGNSIAKGLIDYGK